MPSQPPGARATIGLAAMALSCAFVWSGEAALPQVDGPFPGSPDHPAIEYRTRAVHDAVAALSQKLTSGQASLTYEEGSGFLQSILTALNIPGKSQLLVFSKTGVQGRLTGPANPRALFFNDSVVVGYIRGAPFIEIAAQDPQQGTIFYAINQDAKTPARFVRRDSCLTCHLSFNTLDVPGLLIRSQFTARDGGSVRQLGQFIVDHRTPFDQRWGGYYVTSARASVAHMGNTMVADRATPVAAGSGATLTERALANQVDLAGYPAASSDMAALMVFDHQARMMNLLTRIGWEARVAASEHRLDLTKGTQRIAIDELVDYMLFVDEAPISRAVTANTPFAASFTAAGPRDGKGRSLRDFELQRRLFRHPCSYMIYSPAFDGLPPEAKDAIYRRLWTVLSGGDRSAKYARLTRRDRRAVVDILRATQPGLPAYFAQPVR